MQNSAPERRPATFLKELRKLADEFGFVLLFDEVFTGFRLARGGAQEYFGVEADLVTYGKIVGGGMPIGVVAGRAEIMDRVDGGRWSFGDTSAPTVDATFVAGTYSKHPLAMAASRAVLDHLEREGPSLYDELNQRAAETAASIDAELEARGLPFHTVRCSSVLSVRSTPPRSRLELPGGTIDVLELLGMELLIRGVFRGAGRNYLLSTAHSQEDLESFRDALVGALAALAEQFV